MSDFWDSFKNALLNSDDETAEDKASKQAAGMISDAIANQYHEGQAVNDQFKSEMSDRAKFWKNPDLQGPRLPAVSNNDYAKFGGLAMGSLGAENAIKPNELGLFSKLEQVIGQKMGNKATPQQVEGMLNSAGVKPEEIKYSKLKDFLAGKDKVSKDELLAHVKQNQPQFEEVTKSSTPSINFKDKLDAFEDSMVAKYGNDIEEHMTPEELDYRDQLLDDYNHHSDHPLAQGDTKYQRYTTPGGENYKETLITLPKASSPEFEAMKSERDALTKKYIEARKAISKANPDFEDLNPFEAKEAIFKSGLFTPQEDARIRELDNLHFALDKSGASPYQTNHWVEPNVLAHYRTKDFITPEGRKALLAEEVQSDWHKQGSKFGYKGELSEPTPSPELQALEDRHQILLRELDNLDKIQEQRNFTNEEQAQFDKKLDELSQIQNDLHEPRAQLRAAEDKYINSVPDAPFKKTWHELVMKRLLNRAANEGYDQLSWPTGEMQTKRYPEGGENQKEAMLKGMQGFYDKILPDYVNKFAKKYSQRVEMSPLDAPSMEDTLKTYKFVPNEQGQVEVIDRLTGHKEPNTPTFNSPEEAAAFMNKAVSEDRPKFHTLKLTPEMIEDIKKNGFPLFLLGGAAATGAGLTDEDKYQKLKALLNK